MLQEVIAAAEGADGAAEEKNEMEELKQLLPDIREKVEDAKESQRTASAASEAIQQTLVGTQDNKEQIHTELKGVFVHIGFQDLVFMLQV